MVKTLKKYLEEIHPNDASRQDFIDPYLSVYEVDENGYNSLSQDDIDNNRKRLGRWL